MQDSLSLLSRSVIEACAPEGRAWFEGGLLLLREKPACEHQEMVQLLLARARRKLGAQRLSTEAIEIKPWETGQSGVNIGTWALADAARVAFLLQAQRRMPAVKKSVLIEQCYRLGDEGERSAITRGFILFHQPETLKPLALTTGRSNSLSLFSSLAHFNPYPSIYYTDYEFNQLVLKTLFTGLGIARITGLKERANPELSSMCMDYIDERCLAGRSIPPDIWLALVPCAGERAERTALEALSSDDPAQRYYATLALAEAAGERQHLKEALEQRLNPGDFSNDRSVRQQALK